MTPTLRLADNVAPDHLEGRAGPVGQRTESYRLLTFNV